MLRFTQGFVSPTQLSEHFLKHGARLELASEDAYETAADAFMGQPLPNGVYECISQRGAKRGRRMRYDPRTHEFGVLSPDRRVLSYFVPDPLATALAYFRRQC